MPWLRAQGAVLPDLRAPRLPTSCVRGATQLYERLDGRSALEAATARPLALNLAGARCAWRTCFLLSCDSGSSGFGG